ncbi:putative uncharacterized protein DDB_G0282133 [Homarus americanus]|uniref:putative uncharacterized protein DDB_G0282133 n=1 Tax=Homarus americanus TaxID=6706 RepID=UPI001C4457A2|nr:putative uncharacterized protein DDB_G0282133 [Homarus americanus]
MASEENEYNFLKQGALNPSEHVREDREKQGTDKGGVGRCGGVRCEYLLVNTPGRSSSSPPRVNNTEDGRSGQSPPGRTHSAASRRNNKPVCEALERSNAIFEALDKKKKEKKDEGDEDEEEDEKIQESSQPMSFGRLGNCVASSALITRPDNEALEKSHVIFYSPDKKKKKVDEEETQLPSSIVPPGTSRDILTSSTTPFTRPVCEALEQTKAVFEALEKNKKKQDQASSPSVSPGSPEDTAASRAAICTRPKYQYLRSVREVGPPLTIPKCVTVDQMNLMSSDKPTVENSNLRNKSSGTTKASVSDLRRKNEKTLNPSTTSHNDYPRKSSTSTSSSPTSERDKLEANGEKDEVSKKRKMQNNKKSTFPPTGIQIEKTAQRVVSSTEQNYEHRGGEGAASLPSTNSTTEAPGKHTRLITSPTRSPARHTVKERREKPCVAVNDDPLEVFVPEGDTNNVSTTNINMCDFLNNKNNHNTATTNNNTTTIKIDNNHNLTTTAIKNNHNNNSTDSTYTQDEKIKALDDFSCRYLSKVTGESVGAKIMTCRFLNSSNSNSPVYTTSIGKDVNSKNNNSAVESKSPNSGISNSVFDTSSTVKYVNSNNDNSAVTVEYYNSNIGNTTASPSGMTGQYRISTDVNASTIITPACEVRRSSASPAPQTTLLIHRANNNNNNETPKSPMSIRGNKFTASKNFNIKRKETKVDGRSNRHHPATENKNLDHNKRLENKSRPKKHTEQLSHAGLNSPHLTRENNNNNTFIIDHSSGSNYVGKNSLIHQVAVDLRNISEGNREAHGTIYGGLCSQSSKEDKTNDNYLSRKSSEEKKQDDNKSCESPQDLFTSQIKDKKIPVRSRSSRLHLDAPPQHTLSSDHREDHTRTSVSYMDTTESPRRPHNSSVKVPLTQPATESLHKISENNIQQKVPLCGYLKARGGAYQTASVSGSCEYLMDHEGRGSLSVLSTDDNSWTSKKHSTKSLDKRPEDSAGTERFYQFSKCLKDDGTNQSVSSVRTADVTNPSSIYLQKYTNNSRSSSRQGKEHSIRDSVKNSPANLGNDDLKHDALKSYNQGLVKGFVSPSDGEYNDVTRVKSSSLSCESQNKNMKIPTQSVGAHGKLDAKDIVFRPDTTQLPKFTYENVRKQHDSGIHISRNVTHNAWRSDRFTNSSTGLSGHDEMLNTRYFSLDNLPVSTRENKCVRSVSACESISDGRRAAHNPLIASAETVKLSLQNFERDTETSNSPPSTPLSPGRVSTQFKVLTKTRSPVSCYSAKDDEDDDDCSDSSGSEALEKYDRNLVASVSSVSDSPRANDLDLVPPSATPCQHDEDNTSDAKDVEMDDVINGPSVRRSPQCLTPNENETKFEKIKRELMQIDKKTAKNFVLTADQMKTVLQIENNIYRMANIIAGSEKLKSRHGNYIPGCDFLSERLQEKVTNVSENFPPRCQYTDGDDKRFSNFGNLSCEFLSKSESTAGVSLVNTKRIIPSSDHPSCGFLNIDERHDQRPPGLLSGDLSANEMQLKAHENRHIDDTSIKNFLTISSSTSEELRKSEPQSPATLVETSPIARTRLNQRPVDTQTPQYLAADGVVSPRSSKTHHRSCGFLLRVQEVLRNLPASEPPENVGASLLPA